MNLRTPAVRPAAVAGRFYPDGARELASWVDRFLVEGRAALAAGVPMALIAPHAGYLYSGPIAGSAFALWRAAAPRLRRVVLLGPAHYLPVRGIALPAVSAFATPLGRVPVDAAAIGEIAALPQVRVDAAAHAPEHALEVELPFLQRLLTDWAVVPLLVGDASPAEVAEVLERLWQGEETAVVVSSDLSHYLPYEEARRVDGATAERVCALAGPLGLRQACGAQAINGLLLAAERRGLAAELIDLRNSGDTAGGRDQVVGYGAFAFRTAA